MQTNSLNCGRKQNNRVFQISDYRITGKNNQYSPRDYYNFRKAVTANKSGIAADKDFFYVITGSAHANRIKKFLNKLDIEFKSIINNLAKIARIEKMENFILRKF